MRLNTQKWDPADLAEFTQLCDEAWDSSPSQHERNKAFREGIADAIQAHRTWASYVYEMAANDALADVLKTHHSRPIMVAYNGKIISKPRMAGTTAVDKNGKTVRTRELFDCFTVQQLRDKRTDCLKQVKSYRGTVAMIDKLIALCDAAGCDTPELAAKAIGTTVEDWLSDEAA